MKKGNSNKMRFSIIMPCLFREEGHRSIVDKCIDSVKKHSEDYELIIVDDGSPLDTKFLKEEADVYIRHKSPKGIAPGWNDGIKAAKGKYIVVINDDITARPGWLESMVEAFSIDGAMVSSCAVEHLPAGTGIKECREWFPGSCFMLTKETIDKVGYFDEDITPFYFEDADYWTRVYKSGGKLVRNYAIQIGHAESDVLHKIENNGEVFQKNKAKFLKKHGFDPIPILYTGDTKFPWED